MTADEASTPAAYQPGPLALAFLAWLGRQPLARAARLGSAFGWLSSWLVSKPRRIVLANLRLCFPALAPRAARRLMRAHFRLFGRALFCALALGETASAERVRAAVRVSGREHYDHALATGRRVIVLAPHFVALEIGWLRLSLERPMAAMYREPGPHLLHWALHRNRTRFGGELIERRANPRAVLRRLHEGRPLYYLPDIDPGGAGSYAFVPFFGISTATVTALSRFARLAEAVVIPCVTRETGPGQYELALYPPLDRFPGDDPVDDTRRMNQWIEDQVRKMPEQYFWVHRRFKSRPKNEPRRYARR
jgi:KDO2-lipid IV(A) lauroyltransferase